MARRRRGEPEEEADERGFVRRWYEGKEVFGPPDDPDSPVFRAFGNRTIVRSRSARLARLIVEPIRENPRWFVMFLLGLASLIAAILS